MAHSKDRCWRQVTDVIRNDTTLSANGRWISQPFNLDHAVAYGIEIDGKARLNQFCEHAPPVEVHANLSRYWSQVNGDLNTSATVAHTWVNWTASVNAKF